MTFQKILIYIEPWIEDAKPTWKKNYIWWFGNIINTLRSSSDMPLDVRFILGDDCAPYWEQYKNTEGTPIVITQQELKKVFFDSRTALVSWLRGTYSSDQIKDMARLISSKLDDFKPDLIFTITPSPFLNYLHPSAMILYRDALYCREPWPDEMTCLDPFGINIHGIINILSTELLEIPNTDESDKFHSEIKRIFFDCESTGNPFATIINNLRSIHRHIILLPLQSSGHYNFYSATRYATQFEYLCQVLDDVPQNIGVVVTQHPDDLTLNESTINFLKNTYSNFIYIESVQNYHAPSQLLLSLVDGLISVSSGLCYQALLLGKPIFVIGNSHFLPYSESCMLKDIALILERKQSTRTGIIHWLLTRYFFSYSYLNDKYWLPNHLKTLKENINHYGVCLSIFPKIGSSAEILVNLEKHKRATLKLKDNALTSPFLTDVTNFKKKIEEQFTQITVLNEAIDHRNKIIYEKDDFIKKLHSQNMALEYIIDEKTKEQSTQITIQIEAINHRDKIIYEKDDFIKKLHNQNMALEGMIENTAYRRISKYFRSFFNIFK